jgi:signal peptidase II
MQKKYYIVLAGVLGLIGLDQITKKIFESILADGKIVVIKGFFQFNLSYNDGAAWGILSGNMLVFYMITLVAFGLFYILLKDVNFQTKKLYSIAVILLIAGAIGNFIDRMVYKEVIDFIDFIIFGYDFPIFNIADICLVIGMIMFGIDVLLEDVLHGKFKNRRSV